MGGGAMVLRGVVRTAVAAGVSTPAASSAICHLCTTRAAPAVAPACLCKPQMPPVNLHVASQAPSAWDSDDWEVLEEDRGQHLVFGSVPTPQEVDEASFDLQNAIRLGLVASSSSTSLLTAAPDERSEVADREVLTADEGQICGLEQDGTVHWIEPSVAYSSRRRLQAGGKSAVSEALSLFQRNPRVQGIVRSLATDKAVWEAVWRNEEVQEFRRRLQEGQSTSGDSASELDDGVPESGKPTLFARAKKALSQLMEGVMDLINSVLELADTKLFGESNGDPLDRTIKSCMVLAVMVLMIVSVKRVKA